MLFNKIANEFKLNICEYTLKSPDGSFWTHGARNFCGEEFIDSYNMRDYSVASHIQNGIHTLFKGDS